MGNGAAGGTVRRRGRLAAEGACVVTVIWSRKAQAAAEVGNSDVASGIAADVTESGSAGGGRAHCSHSAARQLINNAPSLSKVIAGPEVADGTSTQRHGLRGAFLDLVLRQGRD